MIRFMRILVIGGSGFIGTGVVAELRRDEHVVATFSRRGDIQGDRKSLKEFGGAIQEFAPDLVVDLILSSGAQARDLMDVIRGGAKRVIAVSSIDVYRACSVLQRLEDGPLEPVPLVETSPLRRRLQTYPAAQIATLKSVFEWLDDEYDKIPVERQVLHDPTWSGRYCDCPWSTAPEIASTD